MKFKDIKRQKSVKCKCESVFPRDSAKFETENDEMLNKIKWKK